MNPRPENGEAFKKLIERAWKCIDHDDVVACYRFLMPIIEYHCLHYKPLPKEVEALLDECSFLDSKSSKVTLKSLDLDLLN